jgi:hypothetical protein
VASAAIPKTMATLTGRSATKESPLRNVMIVAGNGLWVLYGLFESATAIVLFCSLNAILNAAILVQAFKARRTKPPEP